MKIVTFFVLLSLLAALQANAQISVTASSGAASGSYTTLKGAFDKINDGTHRGAVNIAVSTNTTELSTAALYQSGYTGAGGTSTYTTVTIYPTAEGVSITGSLASPLIDLNGADNVTIDGRVNTYGWVKNLTISNTHTSTTNGTSTIRFINDACSNTVKYCTVKGSSTSVYGGIFFYSTTDGSTGNDGNTIDNNDITSSAAANRPLNTVMSAGTLNKENSDNIISNNNIYDFLNKGMTSYGIFLMSSTSWTISGNSFYENSQLRISGRCRLLCHQYSFRSDIYDHLKLYRGERAGLFR